MSSVSIGQIYLNQFRVDAFVASGGMGAVYRVWDIKRNVPLAMKVLHSDLADDPSIFKRFKREANALKKLAHPNIVPFYGLYQTPEFAFLLERFVDGPSLKEILRAKHGKPMSVNEVLIYLKALSAALGYAHANGVVHCDVKPGNVMIDQGGNIYLTDFGIARHSDSTTTTLATSGTAAYMAPEQILGEPVSPATDVYALGVMLFEMLTGQRPFKGAERISEKNRKTSEDMLFANLSASAPDPCVLNPSIPTKLSKVILIALEKKPVERYQSTQTLYADACFTSGIDINQVADRIKPLAYESSLSSSESGNVSNEGNLDDSNNSKIELPYNKKSRRVIVVFGSIGFFVLALIISIGYIYKFPSAQRTLQLMFNNTKPSPEIKTETVGDLASTSAVKTIQGFLSQTPQLLTTTTELPIQISSTPAKTSSPTLTPSSYFGSLYFCRDRDCTYGLETIFPEGIEEVFFLFDYKNMKPNMSYGRRWYVNGNLYLDYSCIWGKDWPTEGTFLKRVYDYEYTLAPGEWQIETYIEDRLQATASFTVRGSPRFEKFLEGFNCNDTSPSLP